MTAIPHESDQEQPRQPRVSIVVAADGSRQAVDVLVDVVQRHPRRASLEVLVVTPSSQRLADVASEHSFVRYVSAPIGAEPGELRANGIRHASGDVVFLLDGDREIDEALVDSLLSPAINAGND
jgi:glycosyltransferase involved in cell wall biosynthesis